MAHKCQKEDVLDMIKEDLKEVKHDVKSLLKYKWQLMGGSAVIGAILAFILSIFVRKI